MELGHCEKNEATQYQCPTVLFICLAPAISPQTQLGYQVMGFVKNQYFFDFRIRVPNLKLLNSAESSCCLPSKFLAVTMQMLLPSNVPASIKSSDRKQQICGDMQGGKWGIKLSELLSEYKSPVPACLTPS